jgi:hypothetical protein
LLLLLTPLTSLLLALPLCLLQSLQLLLLLLLLPELLQPLLCVCTGPQKH